MECSLVFALSLFFSSAESVLASTVTVGTDEGGNTFPFGSAIATQYQQVYASSVFGNSNILINSISFFIDDTVPGVTQTPVNGTYTLSLSETTKAVDGLSSNLTSNIGANNLVVYTGSNSLTFAFSTPYLYDPNAGNLLLNVSIANASGGISAMASDSDDPLTSRAYQEFSREAADNLGLMTAFDISSAVPEPSTWAMLVLGFCGFGFIAHRQKYRCPEPRIASPAEA